MNQKNKISPKEVTITSGTYKLYGKLYIVNKKLPTIILLHGLGFHSFEYEEIAPVLSENGFNCLAFDFRCHGRSEGKRGYWTLQKLVDDVKNAVDYVHNKVDGRIGIFGNSLGAIVAVFAAAQDQRIKSIAASGCPTKTAAFLLTPFRKLLLFIAGGLARFIPFRISMNNFYYYDQLIDNPDWIKKIESDQLIPDARRIGITTYKKALEWDATKIISNVTIPILVLQGKRDKLQPISQSEMLYNAANEPKEFKLLDTGHLPHMENPELISKILIEWFNKTLKGDKI